MQDKETKLGDFRYSTLYEQSVTQAKTSTVTDYYYDDNGNLVKDLNKDIETHSGANGIEYNYLNLPQKVTVKANGTSEKGYIEYVYDATGNKLKKIVHETGKADKTTLYLPFGTYENDVLQFLPMEEGRIRPVRDASNTITSYTYDYFIKDHLGNIRMVLTEEEKTNAYPTASMEDVADKNNENDPANYIPYYSNTDYTVDNSCRTRISTDVPGYPVSDPNAHLNVTNEYVAKVKGGTSGNKIGPYTVLKVMAGDMFNIRVSSWYKLWGQSPNPSTNPLTEIVNALSGGITALPTSKSTSTEVQNSGALTGPINTLFAQQNNAALAGAPKAFLNWILLDDQLNYIASSADPVPQEGFFNNGSSNPVVNVHLVNGQPVTKNGYLYVFVSNETPNIDVFFDNLQVTHIHGPIVEETHYYPFGLAMAGISSKAMSFGGAENKQKFNDGTELESKEFSDGTGLEWYATEFRSYDPQIGRFHQIDPIGEMTENWSPYAFVHNNPLLYNDPLGLDTNKVNVPIPANVQPGQVISVNTPNGGYSSYIYDPSNPEADENGLVANGMVGPEMANVTVSAKAPKKESGGFWSGALDVFQTGLDIVGLIPGFGEIADGANALIYTARGDYTNAALSSAAMIPFAGWLATGSKLTVKTVNVTAKTRKAVDALSLAERILGKGYTEIAPGVYRSADGLKQFRMTDSDLMGKGMNGVPHVHIETFDPRNLNVPTKNYHIPITD